MATSEQRRVAPEPASTTSTTAPPSDHASPTGDNDDGPDLALDLAATADPEANAAGAAPVEPAA